MDYLDVVPTKSGSRNHFIGSDIDIPGIVKIFQLKIPPNTVHKKQCSLCFKAVILACQNQQWEKMAQVGEAILGLRDKEGRSLFSALLAESNVEIIQGVIQHGFHAALASYNFQGDLHQAVRMGDSKLIQVLLKIIGIDKKDSEGKTPLHVAIETGQEEMVEMLVMNGASVEKGYAHKDMVFSSWAYAIKCGQIACFDVLAKEWIQPARCEGDLLHTAVQFGQIDCLRHLLTKYHKQTAPLLNQYIMGYTPLLLAAHLGDEESVALLEEKGASLTAIDRRGRTALHLAALCGHRQLIQLLVHLKIDLLNLCDSQGNRPVDLAKDETIQDCLHNIDKRTRVCRSMNLFPENLLFSGGSCQDYADAVQALPLKEVKRVGGTQGGAIVATLLAFDCDDFSDLTKEELEAKIFKETEIVHCTFGELKELIAKGRPFKHLHLFSDKFHFSSEDLQWKDLIISDTVFPESLLYFKDRGNRRADQSFRAVSSAMPCPLQAFDYKRYVENGLSEEQGLCPIYNQRTLALAVGLDAGERVVAITPGKLGKQAVERFFKNIPAHNERLFYRPAVRKLISAIDLRAPLESFVGREKEMNALENALLFSDAWKATDPVRCFALYGPGGQGKSELACSFANRHIEKFSLIHWVNSETKETRAQSYRDLARALKIHTDEKASPEEIRKALFRKLENHLYEKPWLLILDNVEEAIPYPQRGGCILCTSRSQDCLDFKGLFLSPLTESEAIMLLENLTEEKNEPSMKKLTEELGRSPLMLNNAATYMKQQGIKVTDYLKDLKDDRNIIFDGPESKRYPRSVKKAWALTFEALKKSHPLAFTWLSLSAYLNPVKIPTAWLENWLKNLPFDERASRKLSRTIITALQSYGLIEHDKECQTLSMHHLVQEIAQATNLVDLDQVTAKPLSRSQVSIRENSPFQKAVDLVKKEGFSIDPDQVVTWPLAKLWISQATWIVNSPLFDSIERETSAKIAERLGAFKKIFADYEGAREALKKALSLTHYCPKLTFFSASCLSNMGLVLQDLGNHQEALQYFQDSLKIQKKEYGNHFHPDIAVSLNNIGRVFLNLGKHQEALQHFQDSVETINVIYKQAPTAHIANHLNNIGLLLADLGMHKEALSYLKNALKLRKTLYGKDPHPDTAASLNNIGNVFQALCRHHKGLNYFKQALKMRKELYKENPHPDIAASLNNMGNVSQVLHKHKEALKYYKDSLEILKRIYPEDHPDIASTLSNTGIIYQKGGKLNRALYLHQESLKVLKRKYSQNPHPHVANCLNDIGSVHKALGQHEVALKHFQDSLEMRKEIYGPGPHPAVAMSLNNIGSVLKELGRHQEALKNCQESLEMRRKIYSGDYLHPDLAFSLVNIGIILQALDRLQEALKYYQEAQDVLKELRFSDDDPLMRLVLANMEEVEIKSWEMVST